MRGWWVAGTVSTALAWLLVYLVQLVAGDALPPDISVSQYGVGPHGWLFSLWMCCTAAAPCLFYLYRPVRGHGAAWWLGIGLVGAAVMAIVRTDPGGLQQSVDAKIHMAGSVLALAGLPLGMLLVMLGAARPWRRCAIALVAVSVIALGLLLVSAGGIDTTGAGAATSWSLWQSVAVAADLLLPAALVFASTTIPPLAGDPEPWWTGYRGGAVAVPASRRRPPARPDSPGDAGSARKPTIVREARTW